MAVIESFAMDDGSTRVSWYCTSCTAELGADDEKLDDLGQPYDVCPKCGSAELSWEPWNGEIADGRYFPHDENGHRAAAYSKAESWGG